MWFFFLVFTVVQNRTNFNSTFASFDIYSPCPTFSCPRIEHCWISHLALGFARALGLVRAPGFVGLARDLGSRAMGLGRPLRLGSPLGLVRPLGLARAPGLARCLHQLGRGWCCSKERMRARVSLGDRSEGGGSVLHPWVPPAECQDLLQQLAPSLGACCQVLCVPSFSS